MPVVGKSITYYSKKVPMAHLLNRYKIADRINVEIRNRSLLMSIFGSDTISAAFSSFGLDL